MNRSITLLLLILTMLFWAVNFHVTKIALAHYSPMAVAFWRFLFGAVVLIGVLAFQYGKGLMKVRISLRSFGLICLVSFFGIFLTIYFFNKGLQTASAVSGSLILSTSPIITALLAFFFLNRKFTSVQLFAMATSIFGVIILLVKGDFTQLLKMNLETGDLYILCMALVFSLSQIIVDKSLSGVNSILMTTISAIIGLLMFAAVSTPELMTTLLPTQWPFWASVGFMGVLGTGVGYVAFYYAVVKLGATTTALYGNLIPFFTVLLAFPFGEEVFASQLIGGFVIIIGLLLFGQSKKG
ncbi:MAG: DMT family transporter [Reichenbachiella sp.]|uniref:DMT family transporter n=1 Tax=Reichenbachiella sp. TaxID=2184521 RepID=UPI003299884D